jgi:23S rRNA (uracil1939-C5)-methyltransferase
MTLTGFAFEGKSIARVDGMVVFVRQGVPGDEVRVRLTKVKKQFAEAEIIEVLTYSPLRTTPRCRYFGTCGGCKWQHVGYQSQLDFKRQHVVDALERIGGFKGVHVNETLGVEDPYFYRNKMEFSFGEKWLTNEEMMQRQSGERPENSQSRFALGLHIPERFDRVLDLEECWLQSEASCRIVNVLRTLCLAQGLTIYSTYTHTGYLRNLVIRESKRTGDLMVNLVTSEDRPEILGRIRDCLLTEVPAITTIVNNITTRMSQVAIGEQEKIYHGSGYITEQIGSIKYRVSANSFFQTNTLQAERLYETAKRMARLSPTDVVYDLYCGTGAITLQMADSAAQVIGIEAIESAVEDARKNAVMNNVINCTFVLGDVKDSLEIVAGHPQPDVIIVDPPRSGMHERVVKRIREMRPERVVYVSCNPTTQARDLKLMCDDTEYSIQEVQPVDMFPHTYHIESVVSLAR